VLNKEILNFLLLFFLPIILMAEDLSCIHKVYDISREITEENDLDTDPEKIQIIVGEIDLSNSEKLEFLDKVEFRYENKILSASQAAYNDEEKKVEAIGSVSYQDPDILVFGEVAEINTDQEEINFRNSGFQLKEGTARANAQNIKISSNQNIILSDADFTTCPAGDDDWNINARSINLDVEEGFGDARNITFRFKGIPILYSPYFNFPISNKRKSGILIPNFAERGRTGTDISIPYYFNLAENYDLTTESRYMSKRGLQLNNEFRYLTNIGEGKLNLEYLARDKILKKDRKFITFSHKSNLWSNWFIAADIANISDDMYFEDLSNNQISASQTHLKRNILINYKSKNLFFSTKFQNYQTINSYILDSYKPYDYKPQIKLGGQWRKSFFSLKTANELVNFVKEGTPLGWRFNSNQEIGITLRKKGVYFNPRIELDHTNYDLKNTSNKKHSRTIPISSFDMGINLSRSLKGAKYYQTLEPRLLMTYIPYIDQTNFPIFDTIIPDYSLVQLFNRRQYLGIDRIANTRQISFGATTRIIESSSGEEKVTATLGQTKYLEDQKVGLIEESPNKKGSSDLVGQLSFNLDDSWKVNLGYSKGSDHKKNERIEANFQYLLKDDSLIQISYRSRQELLEQGDIIAILPINSQWKFIGLYSHSFLEKQTLDQFVGLEYESCCWRTRLVGRRYISGRNSEFDSSISIQFQLKGITNNGSSSLGALNRGILGVRNYLERF
tara:strand:- start:19220 stop:21406 length:2187 start_codon:yes stop_codon:yes gene_type:complete